MIPRLNNISRLAILTLSIASPFANAGTLQSLVESAKLHNPDYQQAIIGFSLQEEQYKQAVSNLYPDIGLFGTGSISDTSNQEGSDSDSKTFSAGIEISQSLFNAGVARQKQAEELTVTQAKLATEAAYQRLLTDSVTAYFSVLAANDEVEFQTAQLKAIEKQLEQTKKRYEVGLIAITDVHEGQARFDTTNAARISAQNALQTAKELLFETTGVELSVWQTLDPQAKIELPLPNAIGDWLTKAEQNNLQTRIAMLGVEIAKKSKSAIAAQRLPTLNLTGSSTLSKGERTGQAGASDVNELTNAVSVRLSLPLYTGGELSSQIASSELQVSNELQTVRSQKLTTRTQVRNAWRGLENGIQQIHAREQALRSQSSALEATQAGFDVGTRTIVDVLNQQSELHRSIKNLKQAKYDFLLNLLQLQLASGDLSDESIVMLEQFLQDA